MMPRHGVLVIGTAGRRVGLNVTVFVHVLNGVPFKRVSACDVVGAAVTSCNLNRVCNLFERVRSAHPAVALIHLATKMALTYFYGLTLQPIGSK